jgi:L-ascorbate metabolism protein UlaG (beta-lactamase superfamily)
MMLRILSSGCKGCLHDAHQDIPYERFMSAGLLLLLLVAAWRLNWIGLKREWPEATGWSEIPEAQRTVETSDRLPSLRAGWPVLRWLGHSGFLMEWNGVRILLDPNDAEWVNVSRRSMTAPTSASTWGPIDAVVISHGHQDHLVPSTLRQVPRLDCIILPAGSEEYVRGIRPEPATRIVGAVLREPIRIGNIEIIAVPAAHNGARNHPWASDKKAFGYILRSGGECVYYAGDTGFANDFAGIRECYHPSLAILPIGAFAPRFPLRIHHMDPMQAVEAARMLAVDRVVPCHFGTFTLTLDYPSTALRLFARAASAQAQAWVLPAFLSAAAAQASRPGLSP